MRFHARVMCCLVQTLFQKRREQGSGKTLLDWKQTEGDGLDDGAAEPLRLLGFG